MAKLLSGDSPDVAGIRKSNASPTQGGVPDISAIREEMVTTPGYEDRPTMKAQELDMFTKASDFISDVGDQLTINDSMSGVQNLWRGLFNSVKQAVPEYDEQGNFLGTRSETSLEKDERVRLSTEENRSKLHDNLAAEITAKGLQIISDPLTLLPIGQTYKAAAAIGSTAAAIDMAVYGLAEDGEIDPGDVAIAGAFGLILGPAIKYVGAKVVEKYKDFRLKGASHEDAMQLSLPSPEVLKALPAPTETKRLAAPEVFKSLPAPKKDKLLPAPSKSDAPYFVDGKGKIRPTPSQSTGKTTFVEGPGKYTGKSEEIENAWQKKELDAWIKKEDDMSKAYTATPKSIKEAVANKKLSIKTEKEILSDSIHPNSVMLESFDKAVKKQEEGVELLKSRLNQGGELSQTLMHHLASSSVGAAIGGIYDGPEGAIYGGMIGLGMPLSFRNMRKPIGMIKDWSKSDTASVLANANLWSSPTAVIKGFGSAGRSLAVRLTETTENIELSIAKRMWAFEERVGHLSKEGMSEVRSLLNHTLKPSQSSPKIITAAKQMRREFNGVIDDAAEVGVISKKNAARMKAKASKVGYFPRIYDKDLLASKSGKEAWVKAWMGVDISDKSVRSTLSSIIGDKDVTSQFLKAASLGKGNKKGMSHSQALDLLRLMMNRAQHSRSSHLENSRVISEKFESLLEPFLVKDPTAVIARYYNDSYRRIEAARMFDGVNSKGDLVQDYYADGIFNRIASERSPKDAELARQTYYTVIGDSNSDVIRSSMKLGDKERQFLQGAASFETATKLSTAQVLNMLQATVNGIVRLSNLTSNPIETLMIYSKGFKMAISKEGGEYAQRSGATLETTFMEIVGESSHIGKYGERVLKYSGFLTAEMIQRRLGANIGRAYAESLAAKLKKIQRGEIRGSKARKITKQMREMGLPTQRTITDTDMYRAGLRFSNEINFRNTPDLIPLGWQTPYGKLLTKFKTFAFHQARFIKDNVIKPLLRGNPQPLLWYAGAAAPIGMGIDELRRLMKGDDREFTATERYLRGITSIGGLGLLQDLVSSGATKEGGLASAIAGPAISDAGRVLIAGKKLIVDQNPTKALDDIQRMFVLPGKGYIIDEIASEGRVRGQSRSGGRDGSSRSSGSR